MKNCKTMYYIAPVGKRVYFGRAVGDVLSAQILLDRARRAMPGEVWDIVAVGA